MVAQQLQLQVELAIALLLIYLILVVLVRVHLKQVPVATGTQVDNTAELSMEAPRALEAMELVHQELETLLCTHTQMHLAITLKMEHVYLNHQTTVHKLLVVELAIALLLIFLILAALAQVHHSLDLAVITTQEHQFNKILILGNAQLHPQELV